MFCRTLWSKVSPIYSEILAHPFNLELAQGNLNLSKFHYYLKQDALYLVDFSRALALMAAKSKKPEHVQTFLNFAAGALIAEKELHQSYFDYYDITLDVQASPACFAYTNFLLSSVALGSFAEGMAALLPCFWIYREVGKHIYTQSESNAGPFQKWVDTYASEDFSAGVDKAIELTETLAHEASRKELQQMDELFMTSTRLEWMFWDSAYRLETWPL